VLLTNGKQWMLFRVLFGKPISSRLVFDIDFTNEEHWDKAVMSFEYLTKRCLQKGDLELFWKRSLASAPRNLGKLLYEYEAIKLMRKLLKNKVGINFTEEEVFNAVHMVVTTAIELDKPKFKKPTAAKKTVQKVVAKQVPLMEIEDDDGEP